MRAKGRWFTLHRWLGLVLGLWFALVGLTGSVLVFEEPVDAWLNPLLLTARSSGPALSPQQIEPFLTEAIIADQDSLGDAPRIVAAQENRVLLSRGDRAYARAISTETPNAEPLLVSEGRSIGYRVFRNATPLRDPTTNEVLGYEAHYLGKANVVTSETRRDGLNREGQKISEIVPASLDITVAKEEMRVGDRLLPEPPREFTNFVPRAPQSVQTGQIVSVYGNAVTYAAQNQVVAINLDRKREDADRFLDDLPHPFPELGRPRRRNETPPGPHQQRIAGGLTHAAERAAHGRGAQTQAARGAGLFVVAVPHGLTAHMDLSGADAVVLTGSLTANSTAGAAMAARPAGARAAATGAAAAVSSTSIWVAPAATAVAGSHLQE